MHTEVTAQLYVLCAPTELGVTFTHVTAKLIFNLRYKKKRVGNCNENRAEGHTMHKQEVKLSSVFWAIATGNFLNF
jgi:hypothetical protein